MVRRRKLPARRSPRVAAKQEKKREHIFTAAAAEFAARGYHATTMQDLARAAGFSAASLYTYFPGKQQILEALASATERELAACFETPIPAELPLPQQLEVLLHRMVAFVRARRAAVSFLFSAPPELAGDASPGLHGFVLVCGHFTRWFQAEGRRGPKTGGFPPEVAAQYLTGIIFAAFFRWFTGQVEDRDIARLATEVRAVFFEGIRPARGREPTA